MYEESMRCRRCNSFWFWSPSPYFEYEFVGGHLPQVHRKISSWGRQTTCPHCMGLHSLVEHCSAKAEAMGIHSRWTPGLFFGLACNCLVVIITATIKSPFWFVKLHLFFGPSCTSKEVRRHRHFSCFVLSTDYTDKEVKR